MRLFTELIYMRGIRMNKFNRLFIFISAVIFCITNNTKAFAEVFTYVDASTNIEATYPIEKMWKNNGVNEEKILNVSYKILNDNNIDKNIIITYNRKNIINAYANRFSNEIIIFRGILPYLDNDDELAFIIGHEIGHVLDFYKGFWHKWVITNAIQKKYERRADLTAIDLMVKAGYNPLAAIAVSKKIFGETFDFFRSHPAGSKRLMAQYDYIAKKYPQYLVNNKYENNIFYINFKTSMQKELAKSNAKNEHKKRKYEEQRLKRKQQQAEQL